MKLKSVLVSMALSLTISSMTMRNLQPSAVATVQFTVLGNGKEYVQLGCGSEIGLGARYSVAKDSRVAVTGKVGYILYDVKLNKVITTVTNEMGGKTLDLKKYY